MNYPTYYDLTQAREFLERMNIHLNERQMKRAAEPNPAGKRRLPFFVDPIDGRLKIEKNALLKAYYKRQADAENNCET